MKNTIRERRNMEKVLFMEKAVEGKYASEFCLKSVVCSTRVGQSHTLKMCNRSFKSAKKWDFKFALFSHIFARLLISKEQLCKCNFEKNNQKVRSYNRFEMVRLPFFRSKKSAIWKLHFFAHFCTFTLFENNCVVALFKVQKSAISKFALFPHIFAHSLISKERLCERTFFTLFQRVTKSAIAHLHIF